MSEAFRDAGIEEAADAASPKQLRPITDWLSGILFGPVIQQCDAVNRASSVASSAKADKAFSDLRLAIQSNDGDVLGSFTYADVAMALACDKIKPLGEPYVRAPDAMQRPGAEWMERFGDLLHYRDRMFENHYPSAMLVK
ncbi:g11035 [Coccomyxa viridis]|uniref:G11035 protein n=1 Tax=Coccomyxa viridis TaxID=1274662 RepID=A0ABP1G6X2_9CHLO